MVKGFLEVIDSLDDKQVPVSFAFLRYWHLFHFNFVL